MNRCLQEADIPKWVTKRNTTLIQKGTTPNNYRPITCLPMMWKILTAQIREEIYDLPTSSRLFTRGTESMPWNRATLHWSTHLQREQDEMEKSSYSLDWLQKGIWYGLTKLDNKLSSNVQDIRWSHKLHLISWENHENLESGIDIRRKKLGVSKDPNRYISRRCTIIITICNSEDATYSVNHRKRSITKSIWTISNCLQKMRKYWKL